MTSSRRTTAIMWLLITVLSVASLILTIMARSFDTAKATCGTGLQGMADRLAAAGGTLLISSAPGLGTTVSGRLPVSELAEIRR